MAQLSDQDLILLNGYLDGRLTTSERADLEARLVGDVSLRAELDSLRETVGLLKMAERVPVPRNFTLDPAVYARPPRRSLWEQLGLASIPGWAYAGASLVIVVLCIGAMLLNGGFLGSPTMVAQNAPAAATEAPMEEAAAMAEAMTSEMTEEAAAESMLSVQTESETPAADGAYPPMPSTAASKMGEGPPPEGVGGMGGGAGGEPGGMSGEPDGMGGEPGGLPGGMGGGPAEEPSEFPQPTFEPYAESETEAPEAASSAGQTAADTASGAEDTQESGMRNFASEAATEEEVATIEVTEAKPFDKLKESSWALLLGGTVLLVVIVLAVTVFTRRR